MVTARSAETDWAEGYRLGADYYVTKPFDPAELAAAVATVLTSTKPALASQRVHRTRQGRDVEPARVDPRRRLAP